MKEAYELPVQTNEIKNWPEGPGTYGDSAIVMDADSGAILYAKNIDKKEYPASITKVLTALLAFQYGNMEDTVTISDHALSCLGSGYASIGLKAGDKINMEQALYATLWHRRMKQHVQWGRLLLQSMIRIMTGSSDR